MLSLDSSRLERGTRRFCFRRRNRTPIRPMAPAASRRHLGFGHVGCNRCLQWGVAPTETAVDPEADLSPAVNGTERLKLPESVAVQSGDAQLPFSKMPTCIMPESPGKNWP